MSTAKHILCIETSAKYCSVGLTHSDGHFYKESRLPNEHASILVSLIEEILAQANLNVSELDAIAISSGPGSYTGLRIGASTAKGLCFGLNIPLIAINTLEVLAAAAIKSSDASYDVYWPMIDARRMEVYEALYAPDLSLLRPMHNLILTESIFLDELMDKRVLICGDAANKASIHLPFDTNEHIVQDAKHLLSLSLEYYERSQFVNIIDFEPDYLKFANITASKKRFI